MVGTTIPILLLHPDIEEVTNSIVEEEGTLTAVQGALQATFCPVTKLNPKITTLIDEAMNSDQEVRVIGV